MVCFVTSVTSCSLSFVDKECPVFDFLSVETGESFCVLQGCDDFVVNSESVLDEYECPLLGITKRIFSADCSQIKQAVSIVHECSDSCTFD